MHSIVDKSLCAISVTLSFLSIVKLVPIIISPNIYIPHPVVWLDTDPVFRVNLGSILVTSTGLFIANFTTYFSSVLTAYTYPPLNTDLIVL